MVARLLRLVSLLGLAAPLCGCNPIAWPECYRAPCPYPPVYQNSYAGYVPATVGGGPAFGEPPFEDPFADYSRRIVTVSPGAGNTQAANTALQTATPWPRHSSDTNIPGNGPQMVRAVNDFESGKRPPLSSGGGGGAPGIQINNIGGGATAGASAGGQ